MLRTPRGVVRAEGAEEAAANARVLGAVREVRARVAELLAGGLDEDATRPLREALGSLQPVCVALANPDTPLPEEKREAAALALKQLRGWRSSTTPNVKLILLLRASLPHKASRRT